MSRTWLNTYTNDLLAAQDACRRLAAVPRASDETPEYLEANALADAAIRRLPWWSRGAWLMYWPTRKV